MERPGVAVIIPCFNDGATIREAVASASGDARVQELVVVDDGSDDPGTLAVFGELERDGVNVVHRANGGLGVARMTGVAATRGDYVFCLDADDRLMPGAVDRLAAELDRDPELAVVWGDYRLFGDASYVQETADVLDPWHISVQNDLPASALLRRERLEEAGGWELRGGYEDWDLWMGMAERGMRGRRLPIVVYEYRVHGVRMLADSATRHAEILARLRHRHQALFNARRAAWRRSPAPLSLRLALPVVEALPVSARRRRLLAGAVCHLAHRRGLSLLLARSRRS